jgi:hypothetical protein
MAKFRKDQPQYQKQDQLAQQKMDQSLLKQKMFLSALITWIIAGIFLVFSILMSLEVIKIPNTDSSTGLKVLDVAIKSILIILFFFFMFISMGNLRELRGYIMNWKELIFLLIITLIQGVTDGWVFFISTVGVILIIIYFYLIQVKIAEH